MPVFVNVKDFGAKGDGTTDDRAAIQAAIDSLPTTGGTVYFPPGTYRIKGTIVVGDATTSTRSTRNGIYLLGSGMGKDNGTMGANEGATRLLYDPDNPDYTGDVIKFNGPVEGCGIDNMVLDGNNKAGTLIHSQRSFHQYVGNVLGLRWRAPDSGSSFALSIHASNQYSGPSGDAPFQHLYENVLFTEPFEEGSLTNGVSIGHSVYSQGNCNQLVFLRCMFDRADNINSIGLRLGYCDHIEFVGCHFWRKGASGSSGIGVQVAPQVEVNSFPSNIVFVGTAISGGIQLASPWSNQYYPALIFLPFFSADGQPVPPKSANNGPDLPVGLVYGMTDNQQSLGYHYEQMFSVTLAPGDQTIPWSAIKSHTIKLHKDDTEPPADPPTYITQIGTPRSVTRAFSFEPNIIAETSRLNGITFEEGGNLALLNPDGNGRIRLKNYRLIKFIYCSDTGYWHQAGSV